MAKEDRGFASMDRNKQRDIASKGGKAAHQKGTAHEWTSEEAREAGRKGGMASHRRKQAAERRRRRHRRRDTRTPRRRRSASGRSGLTPRATSYGVLVPARRGCRSAFGAAIIGSSAAPRLVLGGRPTVGRMPLEHVIGVRIPASQPTPSLSPRLDEPRLGKSSMCPIGSEPQGGPSRVRRRVGSKGRGRISNDTHGAFVAPRSILLSIVHTRWRPTQSGAIYAAGLSICGETAANDYT